MDPLEAGRPTNPPPRSRVRPSRRRIALAWLALLACIALVLWLGSPDFSAATTSRFLRPILLFFFPDLTAQQIWDIQTWLRKSAHVTEYALLALLAFRAMWLSFETVVARIAAGALLTALAVAIVDESRQALSGVRTGSSHDVLLDVGGALAAIAIAVAYLQRRAGQGARAADASAQPTPERGKSPP